MVAGCPDGVGGYQVCFWEPEFCLSWDLTPPAGLCTCLVVLYQGQTLPQPLPPFLSSDNCWSLSVPRHQKGRF